MAPAVLSGNRNFEARIHQNIKANFLMSPPLVVAFGLAGTVDIDMTKDAIGTGKDGKPVYLKDIWPSTQEVGAVMKYATDPEMYRKLFSAFGEGNPMWDEPLGRRALPVGRKPPRGAIRRFDGFDEARQSVRRQGARVLGVRRFDHHRPSAPRHSVPPLRQAIPAGPRRGVADFNTYRAPWQSRVMMRGTFANARRT